MHVPTGHQTDSYKRYAGNKPLSKDDELTAVISSTLFKLNRLSDDEFHKLQFIPADEAGVDE